jgi:hypothetical protein
MPPHRAAAERSLALHREVADRIRAAPELIEVARRRVADWLATGSVARPYAESWAAILARPLPEVLALLVDPGERAASLRQVSPFAGILDARARWRVLEQTRERLAGA